MRSRLTRHSNEICALSHRCTITPYANCYIYGYRGQLSVLIVRQDMACLSYSRLPGPVTASHWPPPPKLSMEMGVWFYSWAQMGGCLPGNNNIIWLNLLSYPNFIPLAEFYISLLCLQSCNSHHHINPPPKRTIRDNPNPTTTSNDETRATHLRKQTTIATHNPQTAPFLSSPAPGEKAKDTPGTAPRTMIPLPPYYG